MEIYVAEMSYGSRWNEDNITTTIYVGLDWDEAIRRIKDFDFPSEYNQYGYLYTWVDGQQVSSQLIRE